MVHSKQIAARAALQFYADHGVDIAIEADSVNRMDVTAIPPEPAITQIPSPTTSQTAPAPLGKNDARQEAIKLAQQAQTLDDLKTAIADFEGISIKKTATNLVFADGNPKARIMLIGEAPGADEDRQGKPFCGIAGALLDKILACIDLDRNANQAGQAVYLSNILNWRPPGNRTPSPAEIEVSLPFIERHIQLIQPKFLIFCGGITAKSLLGRGDSISRLRKTFHDYTPQTLGAEAKPIPAMTTYHPAYLLRTPAQKRAVWADMLMLKARLDVGE